MKSGSLQVLVVFSGLFLLTGSAGATPVWYAAGPHNVFFRDSFTHFYGHTWGGIPSGGALIPAYTVAATWDFKGQAGGTLNTNRASLLAPLADVEKKVYRGNFDGNFIAKSFIATISRRKSHSHPFTESLPEPSTAVPEPSSLAMLAGGLGMLIYGQRIYRRSLTSRRSREHHE